MNPGALRGIYAIVDDGFVDPTSAPLVATSIAEAGARVIQLRFKRTPPAAQWRTARAVRAALEGWDGLLLANDRPDVARCADLDGVHLGQDDLPPACARKVAPARGWVVGLSTHTVAEARAARQAPVDYIGFGPVFPTRTKPDAAPVAGLDRLRAVCQLGLPVVAIGGITLDRLMLVRDAGASMAALLSALYRDAAPQDVVRSAVEVFADGR